jgi:hypothetical protein
MELVIYMANSVHDGGTTFTAVGIYTRGYIN